MRFLNNSSQIDFVWTTPKLLLPYMYSLMFVVLSGSQANALIFGKAIILASTPEGTSVDPRLQKVFAIGIVGLVCLLQGSSRINYMRFNNLFAVYKIVLLTFITVTGWCAIGGKRSKSAALLGKSYGSENLHTDFVDTFFRPYEFALALLAIFRVFLGYENANFVSTLGSGSAFSISTNHYFRFLKKYKGFLGMRLGFTGEL